MARDLLRSPSLLVPVLAALLVAVVWWATYEPADVPSGHSITGPGPASTPARLAKGTRAGHGADGRAHASHAGHSVHAHAAGLFSPGENAPNLVVRKGDVSDDDDDPAAASSSAAGAGIGGSSTGQSRHANDGASGAAHRPEPQQPLPVRLLGPNGQRRLSDANVNVNSSPGKLGPGAQSAAGQGQSTELTFEPPVVPAHMRLPVPVRNNTLGRLAGSELCTSVVGPMRDMPFSSKIESMCKVDDASASPVVLWYGFWQDPMPDESALMPAPLIPGTGRPAAKFLRYPLPTAAFVLAVDRGYVIGSTGNLVSRTSIYTLTGQLPPVLPASSGSSQARSVPRVVGKNATVSASGRTIVHYPWYPRSDFRLIHGPPPGAELVDLGSAAMSFVVDFGHFFQHFAFDTLPRIGLTLEFLKSNPHIRILHSGGVSKSFFVALGIDELRLVAAHPDRVYTAGTMYLPYYNRRIAMGFVPAGSFDIVRPLIMGAFPPLERRNKIVYLQRPHGEPRGMLPENERALLTAIRARLKDGYELDDSFKSEADAKHDWHVDKERFRYARAVVAPHGGALGNIIFCAPGTHVVEFIPIKRLQRIPANQRPCYHALAYAADLNYWMVQPDEFGFETPDMVVNVESVIQVLRRIGVAN